MQILVCLSSAFAVAYFSVFYLPLAAERVTSPSAFPVKCIVCILLVLQVYCTETKKSFCLPRYGFGHWVYFLSARLYPLCNPFDPSNHQYFLSLLSMRYSYHIERDWRPEWSSVGFDFLACQPFTNPPAISIQESHSNSSSGQHPTLPYVINPTQPRKHM